MTFSIWQGDSSMTLIEGTQLPSWEIEPMELVKTFEAPSWEEACRIYHEWNEWEPYRKSPKFLDGIADE